MCFFTLNLPLPLPQGVLFYPFAWGGHLYLLSILFIHSEHWVWDFLFLFLVFFFLLVLTSLPSIL